MKTYNIEFDEIIIIFTGQNGRLLEMEDKFDLVLLIKKQKRHVILLSQERENMLKDMNFCHSREICLTNMENKYWIYSKYRKQI